jgi:dienelactone hydrolase
LDFYNQPNITSFDLPFTFVDQTGGGFEAGAYSPFVAYPDECELEGVLCSAVIVAHSIDGISDNEKMYAVQLAQRGYVAFASDLLGKEPSQGSTLLADVLLHRACLKANIEQMFERLEGVMDPFRVGAQGYDLGGNSVMELARGNPNIVEEAGGILRAVQPFYAAGYVARDAPPFATPLGFINPSIRFQLHHAGTDDFEPDFGTFDAIVNDLRAQEVEVWHAFKYGEADHGFMFPSAAVYAPTSVAPALEASYKFYEQAFEPTSVRSFNDPRVHNSRASGNYNPVADLATAATAGMHFYNHENITSFDLSFAYEDLTDGVVHPVGNYDYKAFVAFPKGAVSLPTVMIVHALSGITDSERYYAMELAARGYVAFAADVFGNDPYADGNVRVDVLLHRARLQANVAQMMNAPQLNGVVDPARIGAQGYCFGGTSVMEIARGTPNLVEAEGGVLVAVQTFHGSPYTLRNPPFDTLDSSIYPTVRFQIHHSGPDDFVDFRADYDSVVEELRANGVAIWHALKYGEAPHSFMGVGGEAYTPTTVEPALAASYQFYQDAFGVGNVDLLQPADVSKSVDEGGLSDGAIIGISFGVVAAVAIGGVAYLYPGKSSQFIEPLVSNADV